MAKLIVDGKEYRIEFRHKTKLGKRAQLRKAPLKAVTTCVVMAVSDDFVAIDNALCSLEDPFSRREGRLRALVKVLEYCGPLRERAGMFLAAYVTHLDPEPQPRQQTAFLAHQEIEARKEAGAWKRRLRADIRAGRPAAAGGVRGVFQRLAAWARSRSAGM